MVSINRKLVVAGASGIVIGLLMWISGSIAQAVIPTLPIAFPYACFGIGFAGATAASLSEDIKAE